MLESALGWYQGLIGLYDKQSWETTVEQRILRGLSYTPRKTTTFKAELIDVDLVRGSTFPKAKPQSGIWIAGFHGILRILLFPFYGKWWIRETSCIGFFVVSFLYSSVLLASAIMISCRHDKSILENIPVSEVFLPGVVLLVLSVIHSQIVCTRSSGTQSSPNRKNNHYGVRPLRRIRSLRRSKSASGRGKCSLYNSKNIQHSDKSSRNYNITGNPFTMFHNKSTFKMFRSHSEEPRLEDEDDFLSLQPRSSSETNVSPPTLDSSKKPNIVIFKSTNDSIKINKTDETWSSSAPTSSSERSPVLEQENTFVGHMDATYQHKVDNISGKKSIMISSEKTKNYIKELEKCSPISFHNLSLKKHNKSDDDVESDGEEESGRGDTESPKVPLRDKWNVKASLRCTRCSHIITQYKTDNKGGRSNRINIPRSGNERSSCNSSCESDGERSPSSQYSKSKLSECEWTGITTNSDDMSYSSESDGDWDNIDSLDKKFNQSEALDWKIQGSPAAIITSTSNSSDKVSCRIFEGSELQKVDLSVLDISSAVISKVDNLQHNTHYLQFGLCMAIVIALVPSIYRFRYAALIEFFEDIVSTDPFQWTRILLDFLRTLITELFGHNIWAASVISLCFLNRFCLAAGFFFLLSVAERTFKQRFLYAKHFCYLTSARRARKYDLPHFRLNKVHNIKAWLSVRSCLKKRGPQRSVDVIVSATFFLTLLLVSYLCYELLKEDEVSQHSLYNIELFFWCLPIGIYLIRFTTLGAMINKKYSSLSVLITEQINMYLHMEQKPEKKDELTLANNVLKLVSVLLKELESPFKISGLSANPLLYNITRLVILSAFSGVLSDLLGFKLKLHKIKFEK